MKKLLFSLIALVSLSAGTEVIYIPTEAGLPILEAGKRK